MLVGGSCLAGKVTAFEPRRGAGRCTVEGDVAEHAVYQVSVARIYCQQGLVAGSDRLGFRYDLIFPVADLTDDKRLYLVAAVGKNRIRGDHLPGRY